ncbi:relaxase/mobilization nuclease domain-containing protein [Motilibacter aurantiacus]|uniref:relaxase/mobilization nuclease domain-containing protein n=1 Tax=Motilibacter aurantiacus TaxID=2714955 RepID=UPI00140C4711|nr:relaxase/mobilization nuclease domain-containing protein [Motilibacter aurantiacus]NHC46743.1 relaxase/mobilization nuclease domain-containing protein [Motilibacter aurantiacus]
MPARGRARTRGSGARDFRELIAALDAPLELAGIAKDHPRRVAHIILSNHADDPVLTDEQWGEIAADMMHRTGLAPRGDDAAVRWVAVRHADDHVHVVATMARQDGKRAATHNEFYRLREGAHAAEKKYGLRSTAPADRTAGTRATRAEQQNNGHELAAVISSALILIAALGAWLAVRSRQQRRSA